MTTSFYSQQELSELGLKSYGKNVMISRNACIYGAEKISIGNNVRIDDYCILSGTITIKDYIHIAAYSALYGKNGIEVGNFVGISARGIVYSASDDFSGNYLGNPTIPSEYTHATGGLVKIEDYVQIGANSIVMPDLTMGEGTATGAFTFITKDTEPWKLYLGIPAKMIKDRSRKMLEYAGKLKN